MILELQIVETKKKSTLDKSQIRLVVRLDPKKNPIGSIFNGH